MRSRSPLWCIQPCRRTTATTMCQPVLQHVHLGVNSHEKADNAEGKIHPCAQSMRYYHCHNSLMCSQSWLDCAKVPAHEIRATTLSLAPSCTPS